MEITWYGHSCFRITERSMASVVTDPYDHHANGFEPVKLKADVVTISHDSPNHNSRSTIRGDAFLITGPGEFEIGGVFITGLQTNAHGKRSEDDVRNTMYVFDYNGLTIAHLGNINRVPTQPEIEALGTVHIALVPVGGGGSLNAAKASEIISLLEPNIVIPMHYAIQKGNSQLEPLSKFLKEMGLNEAERLPSLKISSTNSLPEETHIYVLEYPQH
jgi:L-ascorbate metabolism protein UlaG (beta-lactamase superfamily)